MMNSTVLVTLGEPSLSEGLVAELRSRGLEVEVEQDLDKALERVNAGGVGLVVGDHLPPARDALGWLGRCRQVASGAPSVIVLGKDDEDTRGRCYELGASFYLPLEVAGAKLGELAQFVVQG